MRTLTWENIKMCDTHSPTDALVTAYAWTTHPWTRKPVDA